MFIFWVLLRVILRAYVIWVAIVIQRNLADEHFILGTIAYYINLTESFSDLFDRTDGPVAIGLHGNDLLGLVLWEIKAYLFIFCKEKGKFIKIIGD